MAQTTIAIDGPAAAGKGTLSRRLASALGFHHLDTGLTYRATANALLVAGLPLDDEAIAEKMARNIDLTTLDRSVLSAHTIAEAASKIAVMPSVRRVLVDAQRAFAAKAPGTILDGRDIGTVVCPDAFVKIFVTASPDVRAKRRFDEIVGRGHVADFAEILCDVKRRDERDMSRVDSPLRPAADAYILDTSELDAASAFECAKCIVEAAMARR